MRFLISWQGWCCHHKNGRHGIDRTRPKNTQAEADVAHAFTWPQVCMCKRCLCLSDNKASLSCVSQPGKHSLNHGMHQKMKSWKSCLMCAPVGCVDAVGVILEGCQGGRGVHVPQLDAVVPAAAQKDIAPHQIPAQRVHLRQQPGDAFDECFSLTLPLLHAFPARRPGVAACTG